MVVTQFASGPTPSAVHSSGDILVFARPDDEKLYVRSNDPSLIGRLFSYDGTRLSELYRSSSLIEGFRPSVFNYPAMHNGRGLLAVSQSNIKFDSIALLRAPGDVSGVVADGDVINGRAISEIRGSHKETTAFYGCSGSILTTNTDGTPRMLSIEDPCVDTTTQKEGVVTISGANFVQTGLTTQVLANDGKLIDAEISASSITVSVSQLAFGDNSVRVIVGEAKSNTVNVHVEPPPRRRFCRSFANVGHFG